MQMEWKSRQKLFKTPTREYQGKPFWSWNGELEKEELIRQIDSMKEMGFGGFFMHSRTGLETEYLGEKWFQLIDACADYGQEIGMESWLYDEDRWPSGSAGGLVTKEEKYRAMYLDMEILEEEEWMEVKAAKNIAAVFACKLDHLFYSEKRKIEYGETLTEGERAILFRTRYDYCSDNYNGFCYLDTMNQEAVERYMEVTHEQYQKRCGDKFGKEILGIFTDEPHRGACFSEFSGGGVRSVPYTPGLFDIFEERFCYSLSENLPELFLRKQEGELSRVSRDYFELCQELFLENFAIPIYKWCQEHKLIFTGHVLHEDSLCSQSIMQGSLMRFYEYMDYPGVDVLTEYNESYWIVKQLTSVARQLDKKWLLSELYGCTGWQMSFESYKNIGDWQALFGINLRCPHLSWYTMKGEAKRDYPASILHQSPWYGEYQYLEDYYSRIHVAMEDGEPECELLVINPIESVWARAYSGAFQWLNSKDCEISRLEKQYQEIFHWLTSHQIDFDYGEEDIMSRHGKVEEGILYVGNAQYQKVLVAGVDTMRESTYQLLAEFQKQGGTVIFAGAVPEYIDVKPSDRVKTLAEQSIHILMEEAEVAEYCKSGREITICADCRRDVLVQNHKIKEGRLIMLWNKNLKEGYQQVTIHLGDGTYLERWDPRTGNIYIPEYTKTEKGIEITIDIEAGGERLYVITDTLGEWKKEEQWMEGREIAFPDSFTYSLSEPNICVLDVVEIRIENELHLPKMEVLRADRKLRDYLKIPYRGGEMLQPWYEKKYGGGEKERLAALQLEYQILVSQCPTEVELVVEDFNHIHDITVNGFSLPLISHGKWIDVCFEKIGIPDELWKEGDNTICIHLDYYKTCGLEAVYLLGDFGVQLPDNKYPVLSRLPKELTIGDITSQGLPFYSGSVFYELNGLEGKTVTVEETCFGGSLMKLLGKEDTILAFPPFKGMAEDLKQIQVVLTRRNTFGPLHQIPKQAAAYGPDNFITEGEEWEESYVLYEQGLLKKGNMKIVP